jgi:DNA mismatch repair protein MSH5
MDAANEIVMAIDMKDNNTIGCAYYIMYEETLCLQEDIPMASIEIIETLLLQAEPTTVIIHNRAPSKMADFLESHAQDLDGSQGSCSQNPSSFGILLNVGNSPGHATGSLHTQDSRQLGF